MKNQSMFERLAALRAQVEKIRAEAFELKAAAGAHDLAGQIDVALVNLEESLDYLTPMPEHVDFSMLREETVHG